MALIAPAFRGPASMWTMRSELDRLMWNMASAWGEIPRPAEELDRPDGRPSGSHRTRSVLGLELRSETVGDPPLKKQTANWPAASVQMLNPIPKLREVRPDASCSRSLHHAESPVGSRPAGAWLTRGNWVDGDNVPVGRIKLRSQPHRCDQRRSYGNFSIG
jgi:hypothetical protein